MTESLIFSQVFLPLALMIIMWGVGLSLQVQDFKNVLFWPRSVLIGLACQMILLPVIAFILAFVSELSPEAKVGLIIVAACPGGAASNLISYLLKGNVALSISLTAINSLLIIVTIPLIVNLGLIVFMGETREIPLPVLPTIIQILIVTLVPVVIGVYMREKHPVFSFKIERYMRFILPLMLAIAFAGVLFIEKGGDNVSMGEEFLRMFPYAFALNFFSMLLGYFIARSLIVKTKNHFTVAIEVGLQNSALAIFVASSLLMNPGMAVMAVVYGAFSFFTTFIFAFIQKKISENIKPAPLRMKK